MTEKQEKEYIHWQDLAEQLGADPTREIDDYFGRTVTFASVVLVETGLPDSLPVPTETSQTTKPNEIQKDVPQPATAQGAGKEAEPVSDKPATSGPKPDPEIGWVVPDPAATPDPAAESAGGGRKEASSTTAEKRTAEKPAAASAKPGRQPEKPAAPPADAGHWQELASTLGLTPPEISRPEDTREKEVRQESSAAEAAGGPARSDARGSTRATKESGKGAGRRSAKRAEKQTGRRTEKPSGHRQPPRAAEGSSGFGAGILDLETAEAQEPIEARPTASIPEDQARPVELDAEPAEIAIPEEVGMSGDTETYEEPADEFDDDGDVFVEFEVEDLEPEGGRRKRPPRSGRERPSSRPADGEEPEQHSDPRVVREERKRDQREPSAERGAPAERGEPPAEKSRRRRRRRSRSREEMETSTTAVGPRDDQQPSAETADEVEVPSGESGKSKKLPTWSDTIEVIVDANIAARNKRPPRRRRGSRSRRGQGQNRDRS
jgi:hypothetical protein